MSSLTLCPVRRMLAEEGGIAVTWEADEEQEGGGEDRYRKGSGGGAAGGAAKPQQQQQRLSFATASSASLPETSGAGRHPYFRVRKLQRLTECF